MMTTFLLYRHQIHQVAIPSKKLDMLIMKEASVRFERWHLLEVYSIFSKSMEGPTRFTDLPCLFLALIARTQRVPPFQKFNKPGCS
ncbi:hypothetical protein CEXT_443311 [Caerostris extrusa]|uniref:Uncharacterized protein n=1 Tax=Caerostris extrusa TaxID=172846 RepID=A0AAV4RJ99_CAEEX|nr:hypothetical protein CEXT_443311 [Caerostris extrusa]